MVVAQQRSVVEISNRTKSGQVTLASARFRGLVLLHTRKRTARHVAGWAAILCLTGARRATCPRWPAGFGLLHRPRRAPRRGAAQGVNRESPAAVMGQSFGGIYYGFSRSRLQVDHRGHAHTLTGNRQGQL
eukprot:scaffold9884_cov111-Isochrysis_galbana.AAC.1